MLDDEAAAEVCAGHEVGDFFMLPRGPTDPTALRPASREPRPHPPTTDAAAKAPKASTERRGTFTTASFQGEAEKIRSSESRVEPTSPATRTTV